MDIEKCFFGKCNTGEDVHLFSLSNDNSISMKVTNYGCTMTQLKVPGINGQVNDVILGFNSLAGYISPQPYIGSIVGRYANRIAKGRFILNGKEYLLALNLGNNHLHGGLIGFDKVVWKSEEFSTADEVGVKFHYFSKHMEEGYPGNLDVTFSYSLTNSNEVKMYYEAQTDQDTYINLTQHNYYNLNGGTDSVMGHLLWIPSGAVTVLDPELIPTGEIKQVKGSPYDFSSMARVGSHLDLLPQGYDINYLLDNHEGNLVSAAKLVEPVSGRAMEVFTTEPALQLYTAGVFDGSIIGRDNICYKKFWGLCLETQHYPDSPNHPEFPSVLLKPGDTYKHLTVHKFSTLKI